MFEKYLPNEYQKSSRSWSRLRRSLLIDEMTHLDSKELTCRNCVGNCCTFESNSMRITPLEAIEILIFLEEENRINSDLITKLNNYIKDFRLDKETFFGIKKNYTCPFYLGACQGCSISRGSKPYGCLAFNATEKNVIVGKNCHSNQLLLENRELNFPEENEINQQIIKILGLTWTKESIPVALLDIIKKGEQGSP